MLYLYLCQKNGGMEKQQKREGEEEAGIEAKQWGWHPLPAELAAWILHQATHSHDLAENASALIVCRFVCKQ